MTDSRDSITLALLSAGLLIAGYTLHYVLLVDFNLLLWSVKILPLILLLPGLQRRHTRTHQWLGFLSLFYVLDGILIAAHPEADIARLSGGILITLLALLLYLGVIVHVRQKKKNSAPQSDSQDH